MIAIKRSCLDGPRFPCISERTSEPDTVARHYWGIQNMGRCPQTALQGSARQRLRGSVEVADSRVASGRFLARRGVERCPCSDSEHLLSLFATNSADIPALDLALSHGAAHVFALWTKRTSATPWHFDNRIEYKQYRFSFFNLKVLADADGCTSAQNAPSHHGSPS